MAGPFLDRARARHLMAEARLDALVLCQPETFAYATGGSPGVAALFRRAGAAMALIPADDSTPAGAVVGDTFAARFRAVSPIADVREHPLWIETADIGALLPSNRPIHELIAEAQAARPSDFARPATFDLKLATAQLRDMLAERGLARGRIGIDGDFVPAADLAAMRRLLPEAELIDASAVVGRLKAIKHRGEIALLRAGAEMAEAGIVAAVHAMRHGEGIEDLRARFRATVHVEAAQRGVADLRSTWEYISIGPEPWGAGGRVEPGAIVKIDVGCVIDGYSSDSARTFAFGRAGEHARQIHAALESAFAAGLSEFRPGNPLAAVHRAAERAMRAAGFAKFSRGHFGHGIGYNVFSEEWPFTAADAEIVLEPGMVLAFETPFYVDGVGGFIVEDQILVTENGAESMNALPRRLVEIG